MVSTLPSILSTGVIVLHTNNAFGTEPAVFFSSSIRRRPSFARVRAIFRGSPALEKKSDLNSVFSYALYAM
tara:strand:- start:290 stop:502 length:213 start_codon:yes stop_codon:yes gene_type:complete